MVYNTIPPLLGLVLAGGRGSRLGRDKGALNYHGQPQARWLYALLARICPTTFVSIRPDQAHQEAYVGLPQMLDEWMDLGPAGGLATAVHRVPTAAWLVVAADMPLLTASTLETLVANRDARRLATAFRHADGTAEPLCAIWEPAVVRELGAGGAAAGAVSLRRLLGAGAAQLLEAPSPHALRSVNTPGDDAFVRTFLAAARSVSATAGNPC